MRSAAAIPPITIAIHFVAFKIPPHRKPASLTANKPPAAIKGKFDFVAGAVATAAVGTPGVGAIAVDGVDGACEFKVVIPRVDLFAPPPDCLTTRLVASGAPMYWITKAGVATNPYLFAGIAGMANACGFVFFKFLPVQHLV